MSLASRSNVVDGPNVKKALGITRFDLYSPVSPSSIVSHSSESDQAQPPQCRTCKKTLDNTLDRMKTRDKWWTNCKSCRTTNTIEWRRKKDSGFYQHGRSRPLPTGSAPSFTSSDVTRKATATPQSAHTATHGPTRKNLFDKPLPRFPASGQDVVQNPLLARILAHKSRHSKKARPTKRTECSVCADLFTAQDFIKLSACTHQPDICKQCFLGWLNSQLDSTTWENIQCPSSSCSQAVTHADVKAYATDDLFTRFDELSMRALLSNDPDFRYCLAEGCNSGQIHDTGTEGNIYRCQACNFRVCTIHDVAFHTDETCAQYDERRRKEEEEQRENERIRQEQDQASRAEIEKTTTNCPGCEVPIHKYIACDHITCARCHFEFCYICRAPYQGANGIFRAGNAVHTSECKYHSDNLRY